MTREALVCLLLLAAVCWTMANRCWATVRYYQRPRTFLPLALRGR